MPPKSSKPPKSKAEMMRAMRARRKEDDEAAYNAELRENYHKRKAAGKVKTIKDLPERDQRLLRRKWKIQKREQRKAARPNDDEDYEPMPTPPPTPSDLPLPHQKSAGRKKLRRESKRAYRTIKSQKNEIKKLKAELKKMQRKEKKNIRLLSVNGDAGTVGVASPATKANSLAESGDINRIRKELTFGFALHGGIKESKSTVAGRKQNRTISCANKLLKKYRLIQKAEKELGMSRRLLQKRRTEINKSLGLNEDSIYQKAPTAIAKLVTDFFLRDDVSRPAAGKKETKTLKKEKRLKRYQCDTLKNLRLKFLAEYPNLAISYTSFTRLKPFYVVAPCVNSRDTTACKLHTNSQLLANKLWQLRVLKTDNLHDIIQCIVCSTSEMKCMYLECDNCKNGMGNMYTDLDPQSFTDPIEYHQWQSKSEARTTTKVQAITVNIHSKELLNDSVSNVCRLFELKLKELLPHQYRVYHQYKEIRNLKSTIASDECVLQIDFSENYECKLATEIMSMHFGASKRQVALHTCHATLSDAKARCYCTMSDDTRHGTSAIWAHLKPVLLDLREIGIKKIHFVSDGPTSQYRNKTNFFLLANIPFSLGFEFVSWNFLESGHGKGPADGVGAAVKNAADRVVAYGGDIPNLDSMVNALNGNLNVRMSVVTPNDIADIEGSISDAQPKPIKGTLKIHQIDVTAPGCFRHRTLSCFCNGTCGACDCHLPETVDMPIHVLTPHVTPQYSTIDNIEVKLTETQKNLFQKRLLEGYDVVELELDSLTSEKKNEYLLWKVWRSQQSGATISSMGQPAVTVLKEQQFYSVMFTRGAKRSFYIGRLVNTEAIEIKFLERVGSRSQFTYDWPRRDDILNVERKFIITEVTFEGPPPFTLDINKVNEITSVMTRMGDIE